MAMTAEQERAAFYYELGVAITQWAHVERTLCDIATFCFARDPSNFSMEQYADHYDAFFAIENFRSKVEYTSAVFERRYGTTDYSTDWKTLANKLGKRATMRNHLAHYPVMNYVDTPPGRRICIAPRQIHLGKSPTYLAGALFLADIIGIRLRFRALDRQLESFLGRLRGLKDTREERPSLSPDMPTIQKILDQTLAMFGRLPQASEG